MEKEKKANKIYFDNEINANKGLAKGCLISAIALFVVWILYLTGLFQVRENTLLLINVSFPILIVVLGSTIFYTRTRLVEKESFKYFLISLFLIVIFTVNVLLPKHGILLWAAGLILVNHYFSPKMLLFTYILTAILMFFALYFGMFFGEWDPGLLNGAHYIELNGEKINVDNATYEQRIEWIHYLRNLGDNRYLKTFIYYYLPRLIILTVIANIGYSVSKRTRHLLVLESIQTNRDTRIKSELNVAKAIQYNVLPKELSDDNKDNIFGLMTPAKEIGGDFYDYFYIDKNHLALVVADVSGKGIPAALFMMKTESLIRSLTQSFKSDTSLIMSRSNISLCDNNHANIFVTCWLGIINLVTGELSYTNAGHNKIILIHDGNAEFLDSKPGVVLGAFEQSVYREVKINLSEGDKLILYTDGITEAHNKDNVLYGEKRLINFSNKYKNLAIRDFVKNLKNDVDEFSKDYVQFDDITILGYKFEKRKEIFESRIFNADLKELDNVFEYSSNLLKALDFSNRDITMINTAIEEVFVNIAKYAYDNNGTIEISLSEQNDFVKFVFKDSGVKFNPLELKDPNINAKAEEREIGGLGIYMVKKIMNEVYYEYTDNQNILTLIKYKNQKEK